MDNMTYERDRGKEEQLNTEKQREKDKWDSEKEERIKV
jgi:hypothetical protein